MWKRVRNKLHSYDLFLIIIIIIFYFLVATFHHFRNEISPTSVTCPLFSLSVLCVSTATIIFIISYSIDYILSSSVVL